MPTIPTVKINASMIAHALMRARPSLDFESAQQLADRIITRRAAEEAAPAVFSDAEREESARQLAASKGLTIEAARASINRVTAPDLPTLDVRAVARLLVERFRRAGHPFDLAQQMADKQVAGLRPRGGGASATTATGQPVVKLSTDRLISQLMREERISYEEAMERVAAMGPR